MMKNKILGLSVLLFISSFCSAEDKPSVQAMKNYEKQYEVMMNNVINANTPGFRSSKVITKSTDGKIESEIVPTTRKTGGLVFSGDPLHIGIDGPGYFMVTGPNEKNMYTRDGRFKLNSDGVLVTLSGEYPVQGEGGDISITPEQNGLMKIAVSEGGLVVVNGSAVDRLLVGEIIDHNKIKSVNGAFFMAENELKSHTTGGKTTGTDVFLPMERFSVRQYYYEASNVDVAEELVSMPQISKKFDANSKVLQIMKKIRTTGREMGNAQ